MKHSPASCIWLLPAAVALALGLGSVQAAWQLAWSDEFNGSNVDTSKWAFEAGNGSGGWGNGEREYYTNRNASVSNGVLHIVAKQESLGGFPYTSARMKTQGLYSKQYGRFEFRARLPQGLGFWPALWLLGNNITPVGWPACGEVDIMENNGSWSNQVQGTIHYSDSGNNHLQQTKLYTLPGGDSVTNFHIYALEWSTNSLKWLVDTNPVQTWTSWSSSTGPYPAPFNQPFFIILNLAVGGSYLGNPTDTQINSGTTFPGEMQVDYVRVYDYVATIPDPPTSLTVGAGNAKAFLSWDASTSGATSYNVKRATNSGGPYTIVATPATNGFIDTGVSACSAYYYVVSATNSLGESTNSSEAAVALSAFSLAINSGGGAAAQFASDTNVTGGAQAGMVSTAIDTTSVVAPAPQAVYQTERYGNFTYTFTGLTAGMRYKLRLHFAETYWTAVGQRRFNVSINGTQVLTNFDIVAVAGAPNKANIQEFTATPNSGQLTVQYATVTDNAKSSGLELILPQPAAPAGLLANAGDSVTALNWTASTNATSYNVRRSLTGGGPYTSLASSLTTTNYADLLVTNGTTYYYVVSAVNSGCESTNSAQASATPACSPPAAPAAGNNSPVWAGTTLNLTASTVSGASYSWTGPNGFASTNQNPSISGVTTNASGVYNVAVRVGTCTSPIGTTVVAVNPLPLLSFSLGTNSFTLIWPGGTLQVATNVSGSWTDLPGATNPYTVFFTEPQQFFRLKFP